MSDPATINKVYISKPNAVRPPSASARLVWRVLGTVISPAFVYAASREGAPGIEFHRVASRLACTWLISNRNHTIRRWLFNLIGNPMILTRYQEFDFAWRKLPKCIDRYLDVSSPCIFPLRLMAEHLNTRSLLLNPDSDDIQLTRHLVEAAGLVSRCTTSEALISQIEGRVQSFDVITSLSVIEHIPATKPAIERMWELLKPGGTLIITVPCAAYGYALYTDVEHYGLLDKDSSGFAFFEYLFDDDMLKECIFSVTGLPQAMEIFGEINSGFLRAELHRRWSGEYVRFWEEPLKMGREFKPYDTIAALPGEGVVCMSFLK